jgi:hypothetical protein
LNASGSSPSSSAGIGSEVQDEKRLRNSWSASIQRLRGMDSIGIESRTLLPSPQCFQRAFTIFDSRGDHKPPLVLVQPARYWQEGVPDFGLKLLTNPPRVG